jgi:hypothetical protein
MPGSNSTSLNQTGRSLPCLGMILSENRFTLFEIMPYRRTDFTQAATTSTRALLRERQSAEDSVG